MSEKEEQNFSGKEQNSDDEQIENIGNGSTTLDNTVQMSHNLAGNTDHNLQYIATEVIEVDPSDVINVEELSHDQESSSGSSGCIVTYEFPSDDENDNGERSKCNVFNPRDYARENSSHLPEAYLIPTNKTPQVPNHAEYSSILKITEERKGKLVEIFATDTQNKGTLHDACTAETSGQSERKRKVGPISSIQSKRQKEVQSSSTPVIIRSPHQSEAIVRVINSAHSSDEFAGVEDNAKDSSSSDNNDSKSTDKTDKEISLEDLFSSIQQRKEPKPESPNLKENAKINYESSSLNSANFKNMSVDKNLFPTFLKGETLPIILSDEMKRKFELSIPTIFEVRESSSDEQITQPLQSAVKPLKKKTKVVNRSDKCNVCKAKLGLCAIKCRCGGYYCPKHRYDREHNCTFDYRSMGAAEIQKNNPRIVAEKVRKL